MYKALYRAYRPEVFEEMLGQEHIVKILKNQIKHDEVSHAYLFCGTRGTGKTTTARLLAKAVNCLSDGERPCGVCENCKAIASGTFMDLVELDAASNRGIDSIRELRESVNFPPVIGRKKVYIIDEVHMLTKEAFNALLKTLEEPPESVMFILATTEPQKLPQTILSRCIRLDFKRVGERALVDRMAVICKDKDIEVDIEALRLVATNADGSVRDGLTLLDQCLAGVDGKLTRDDVLEAIGAVGEDTYIDLVNNITTKNIAACMLTLDKIFADGKDARQVLMGLTNHYRNLLLTKYIKNPEDMLNMSLENVERVREQSETLDLVDINEAILELSKTSSEVAHSTQPRILLELVVVKLASGFAGVRAARPDIITQGCGNAAFNIKGEVVPKTFAPKQEIKESVAVAETEKASDVDTVNTSQIEDNISNSLPKVSLRDMEEIWDEVCERASGQKANLSVLRRCTTPRDMSAGEFVVMSTNPTTKSMLEANKSILTEILQEVTGESKHLVVAGTKGDTGQQIDAEETAQNVADFLGLDKDFVKQTD